MESPGFMHKYFDWAAFEVFVKSLYEGDGEVVVQRDVTRVDRYGAKRQIDVQIIRQSRFHRFVTLVECKRWKEPVSRDRIDVLAASVEALGASNGAIFTTTGFEEGAIAYAKGKGIELFVVRDLTPEEWGQPGRHVEMHLHLNTAELRNIQFAAQAISLVDGEPGNQELSIDFKEEKVLDPEYDLYSVKTGERGANLIGILWDVHGLISSSLGNSVSVVDGGKRMTLEFTARCELDLSATEFHQLRLPKLAARIERIGFIIVLHIHQSTIQVDRGKDLDFAVMIESFVSDQRLIAHRKAGSEVITFANLSSQGGIDVAAEAAKLNGSTIRVYCSPWFGLGDAVPDKKAYVTHLIRAILEMKGSKPQLSLVTQPLVNS